MTVGVSGILRNLGESKLQNPERGGGGFKEMNGERRKLWALLDCQSVGYLYDRDGYFSKEINAPNQLVLSLKRSLSPVPSNLLSHLPRTGGLKGR